MAAILQTGYTSAVEGSKQKTAPPRRFTMRAIKPVSFWSMAAVVCAAVATSSAQVALPIADQQVLYEMTGEFNNSGSASQQYGYLSSVTGLANAFSSTTTKNETTALFTFVTNATTYQVLNNGPFRIVDRTGTTTIYLNSGPSDFTNPVTFSQGMPIQVSNYHQQVILNTGTNAFLTVHTNTVTHVETFTLDGVAYRLGNVGKSFRTNYSGQSNAPGAAPSGWFAGTSIGSGSSLLERVGVESD
jgi:hypothetical protein